VLQSMDRCNLMTRLKMIFIGNAGVGKSSLIMRMCHDCFSEQMLPTVGVNFESLTTHLSEFGGENTEFKITFWDLGGQDSYKDYCKSFAKDYHIAAFTFDLTDRKSFEDIRNWLDLLKECDKGNLKYLIGTKMDLYMKSENLQAVSIEEIVELKNEGNFEEYILTSSKLGTNIKEPILAIIHNAIRKYNKERMN
jgi:small GTP-binding protein